MSTQTHNPHRDGQVLPVYGGDDLFEAGLRDLADIVAPTSVEVFREHVLVDGRYMRHYLVTGWARKMYGNWMARLFALKLHGQTCSYLGPFDSGMVINSLQSDLTKVESQRMSDALGKKVENGQYEIGSQDDRSMLSDVQKGTSKLFSVGMTIAVSASTLDRLESRCQKLELFLRQLQLETRPAYLLQDAAWRTCSFGGVDTLLRRSNKPDSALAMDFPFASATPGTGDGAFVGFSVNERGEDGEPIWINPWSRKRRLADGNIVVVGKTGTGKSALCKKLGLGMLFTGLADWAIIDLGSEYQPITEGLEGESQTIDLTQGSKINPLDLSFGRADIERRGPGGDLLAEDIDNRLIPFFGQMVASKETPMSNLEEAHLCGALKETFARAGITNEGLLSDPAVLRRPAPRLPDLVETLRTWEKGDPYSLIERLERYLYLFRDPTGIVLDRPLTVFSAKGLDKALYPLMIFAVNNFLTRRQAEMNYSRFLLFMIEEAWHMLAHPSGRKYLENCARTVRKQAISLVTISQQPNDFLRDGETILGNAGTVVMLGMDQSAVDLLKLSPRQADILTAQRPGEGLIRMGNEYAHMRVALSPLEYNWFTTDPNDLQAMARVKKNMRALR